MKDRTLPIGGSSHQHAIIPGRTRRQAKDAKLVSKSSLSHLMMQLISSLQHRSDFIGNLGLEEAVVDDVLAHFLDFIDSRVGRVVAQVIFNVLRERKF